MCTDCDDTPEPRKPEGRTLNRRSMLLLGAGVATGILAGMWSCREEEPPIPGKASLPPDSQPTTAPMTAATSEPNPQTLAATEPVTTSPKIAPDLGAEIFPDAAGKAIASPADAPVIILPRADWTHSGPNLAQIDIMNGINRLTVHHTGWHVESDAWKPTAGELENIREFHAGTRPTDRQWADIAYHFVVDRAGRVWQARPLAYQGAHVRGFNEHNLGIVLLGNFEEQSPSAAQLTSLGAFIGFVRKLYAIPLNQVFTHGELGQTDCPGKTLESFMNRARLQWAAAERIPWTPLPPPTKPSTAPARSRPSTH